MELTRFELKNQALLERIAKGLDRIATEIGSLRDHLEVTTAILRRMEGKLKHYEEDE